MTGRLSETSSVAYDEGSPLAGLVVAALEVELVAVDLVFDVSLIAADVQLRPLHGPVLNAVLCRDVAAASVGVGPI